MRRFSSMSAVMLIVVMAMFLSCDMEGTPQSSSGVTKASADVVTNEKGLTVEQENVKTRLEEDNTFGSLKHLYIISPYTGQVILYSTVDGKVTSSGKRLTPGTTSGAGHSIGDGNTSVAIGERNQWTNEVLGDDGTYGSSVPYIYWWDAQGRYRQHFFTGGQIIHIASEPVYSPKSMILQYEIVKEKPAPKKIAKDVTKKS